MFAAFSKWDQIALRVVLASAWFAIALGAFLGFLNPGPALSYEVGELIARASNITVIVFGIGAGIGVAAGIEWFEWTAAWFVSGGVAIYALVVWIAFSHDPTRGQTAGYFTGTLLFVIYRALANAAFARRQRDIHKIVMAERARAEALARGGVDGRATELQ